MVREDRFCPKCGDRLEIDTSGTPHRPTCPSCGHTIYRDPKLVATAVIEQSGKILMIRRATEPGLGLWSLPGGYVDQGELVSDAAVREVSEETGFNVSVERLIGLFSEVGRPVVVAAYHGRILDGHEIASPEVLEVAFFNPEQLPPLAFPQDLRVLEAWSRLRDSKDPN